MINETTDEPYSSGNSAFSGVVTHLVLVILKLHYLCNSALCQPVSSSKRLTTHDARFLTDQRGQPVINRLLPPCGSMWYRKTSILKAQEAGMRFLNRLASSVSCGRLKIPNFFKNQTKKGRDMQHAL